MMQNVKADKIILWLDKEEFTIDSIPKSLKKLLKYGLDIRFYHNIRSYKKLVPTLKLFHDYIIITADDDFFYPKNFVEGLYTEYKKDNKKVYCYYGFSYISEDFSISSNKPEDKKSQKYYKFQTFGTGVGVLFPPHILDGTDALDEELFVRLIPSHDDIFYSTICYAKKIEIKHVTTNEVFRKNCTNFFFKNMIFGTQGLTLTKELLRNNKAEIKRQVKNIIEYYNIKLEEA